jgi:Lipocalin-like domain
VAGLPDHARGLVGHWTLVSWDGDAPAGERILHGGPHPRGDLIYLPSGRMAVQIAHDDRRRFGSRDLGAGDDALQAAAYRTYIAYAGRFSIPEPGFVVHHVEQALHPDQAGMDKRRAYVLEGAGLTLRTQPVTTGGIEAESVLRWRRRDDPAR